MTSEDPRSLYIQEVKMKPSIRIDYFPSWKINFKQTYILNCTTNQLLKAVLNHSIALRSLQKIKTTFLIHSILSFFFPTDHYTKARIELHRSVNLSTKSWKTPQKKLALTKFLQLLEIKIQIENTHITIKNKNTNYRSIKRERETTISYNSP